MGKVSDCFNHLDRGERVMSLVLVFGLIIGGLYLIIHGLVTHALVEEFYDNATVETCDILSVSSTSCQYCCDDCGDGDCCEYCDALAYDYTAIAYDKCGNQTLFYASTEADYCPGKVVSIDNSTDCYVLDCDETEFRFNHEGTAKHNSEWALFVIMGLFVIFCTVCSTYSIAWCECYKDDEIY